MFKNFEFSDNFIKILGKFDENKWYPIMKMETNDEDIYKKFDNLNYDTTEIEKAKKSIDLINKKNNYWHIPKIIKDYYENIKKDNLLHFIELLQNKKNLKKKKKS